MKNSKIIMVVFVVAIAILGLWQLPEQNIANAENSESSESVLGVAETTQQQSQLENQQSSEVVNVDSFTPQEPTTSKSIPKSLAKKPYESDWCVGRELSENDLLYAQNELIDWYTLIGKVSIHSVGESRTYDLSNYIEPYVNLPYEELKELVRQRDKWAMVTFVQDSRFSSREDMRLQTKVAEELLIQGASHEAINKLVSHYIVKAMGNIREKKIEMAKDNVINALVHVYWGLEHHNGGGMGLFLAITDSDELKTKIPLETVLEGASDKINRKLAMLTKSINEQRTIQGIEFPVPPVVAKNVFAGDIAHWQHNYEQQMELLRSLDIAQNTKIAISDCVKKHLVFWDKVSK